MARWHFDATQLDRRVARAVARHASPAVERPARLLTWAADEHVLYVIAGGLWLAARAGEERERRQTDHLALSVVVTAILPHLLKRLIDQERPDRCMVHGRRHGIPRSGKAYDAFPSGHAMHVGAVASAVSWWNGVCGRCPKARSGRTSRRAKRASRTHSRNESSHPGSPRDSHDPDCHRLVTVLLLLMFKPTRIPVLVILGALLLVWLFAGH